VWKRNVWRLTQASRRHDLLAGQDAPSGAAVAVGLRLVDEHRAVEQRAFALVVDGAVGGHARHDAFGIAGTGLFSIRVAGVGHHGQRVAL
jgi:hypothetical protein